MAAIADLPARPPPGLGRLRRIVGAFGVSIGLTTVFLTSLATSVVLHLDLRPTRRVVRKVANQILGSAFQGRLEVGAIDRLNLHGLSFREVKAFDPRGAQVIHAAGLRADADVLAIAKSAVLGTGDMRVALQCVHLDHADVALEKGPSGLPTIAEIFVGKEPPQPPPPGGRKVRFSIERIELGHVWAHGGLVPPTLDAELARTTGRFEVGPDGMSLEVSPVDLVGRAPLPKPLSGAAAFKLKAGGAGGGMEVSGDFNGQLGDIDVHATAQVEGTHVRGRVELPHVTAAAIAALVPGEPPAIPLRVPVAAVVDAEGQLPEIGFKTRLRFEGGGDIGIGGTINTGAPLTVDVNFGVHGVDPRVALEVPSATPIDATAHVRLELGEGMKIDAQATTQPFSLANNVIPGVDASAGFAGGVWRGTASVHEKGAPVEAKFSFAPKDGVLFEVDAKVASIRDVARIHAPVDGAAGLQVKGSLKDGALDARVSGAFGGVRAPGEVALTDGRVEARVKGPLAALAFDATVTGNGLHAGNYAWDTMKVHAEGPVLAPKIEAALEGGTSQSIWVDGAVDAKQKAVSDVHLKLERKGEALAGEVSRVAATGSGLKIEGVRLAGSGVGEIKGGLEVVGKELVGKLRGDNIDLAKVAHLAGLPLHVAGLANVDVDLASSRPGQRTGHVAIELVKGEVSQVTGISGLFAVTFKGDQVQTDDLVRLVSHAEPNEEPDERCDGAIAEVRVSGKDGHVPGPLLDPATWTRVVGKLDVAANDWNLRCLAKRVPGIGFLVSDVRGKVTTQASLERHVGARLPTLSSFFARTKGLEVAGPRPLTGGPPAWESRYTDVEVRAKVDPVTGLAGAKLTLLDGEPMGSVSLSGTFDMPALLDHPAERVALLRRSFIQGHVSIPRRAVTGFAALPSFVSQRIPLLAGDVALEGDLEGSLEKPSLKVKASAWGLAQAMMVETPATAKDGAPGRHAELGPFGLPIDAGVTLTYDGAQADLDAHVRHGGSEVLGAQAAVALPLADLMAGRVRPKGSAEVTLDKLPLADVPFFADRGIDGHLSGDVKLTGLGETPTLKVDVAGDDLRIGGDLTYDRVRLGLDIAKPKKTAEGLLSDSTLTLELASDDKGPKAQKKGPDSTFSGSFKVTAANQILWKDKLAPVPWENGKGSLTVEAKRFRIAAAAPFLAGVVSRLDGQLDGKVSLSSGRLDDSENARLDVGMTLSHGVFYLPQLGQELHDAGLKIASGAGGVLNVSDIRARGVKGLLTGSGDVRLNGLAFRSANVGFKIKEGDELPITLEGVPLGDARGELAISAEAQKDKLAVKVGIPMLHVELPPTLGRSVQKLDENPDVNVRYALPTAADEEGPSATKTLSITFDPLRLDVTKAGLADVSIAGSKKTPLQVVIGGKKPVVRGDLIIQRGKIELLKKQFEIEPSQVHMRPEDPGNPYVNFTARWDSPDGPIYVDYIGIALPFTGDKLKYRSPSIPEDRIQATLLFGGVEQQTLGGSGNQSNSGVPGQGLMASAIASQLSTQLGGGLSTSIGTSDDGSFRPGLKYQAGPAQIELSTYDATGSNTGATTAGAATPKGQHSLVTVDWRFWKNWLLRGRVDVGSDQQTLGFDMLWQYRY